MSRFNQFQKNYINTLDQGVETQEAYELISWGSRVLSPAGAVQCRAALKGQLTAINAERLLWGLLKIQEPKK